MDAQLRQQIVNSGNLIFTRDSQKSDLLDENKTQDCLLSLIKNIVAGGFHIGVTSVVSDHSDDSGLGLHSHANGYAMDCWPTTGENLTWLDAGDEYFPKFLQAAAASPYLWQIGLAGTADTAANRAAAGPTVFPDSGEDHIHLGAQTA